MSPEPNCRGSRRASASKPYSKTATQSDYVQPTFQEIAQLGSTSASDIEDQPGFPTYANYKLMETAYIASLHPQRRSKALLTQSMFDRIRDVLNDSGTPVETAQFRFWVRKTFSLGRIPQTIPGQDITANSHETTVLHNKRPVAIQEQLYQLLCHCHRSCDHGGRDKTIQSVRKHYSWVPKELVLQFVKMCPTCMLKKTGNSDLLANDSQKAKTKGKRLVPSLPSLRDFLRGLAAEDSMDRTGLKENLPHTGSLGDDSVSSLQPVSWFGSTSFTPNKASSSTLETLSPTSTNGAPCSTSSLTSPSRVLQGYHGIPMSREVSLYQGLPNGWQYHTDYATAYAACMKNKGLPVDPADEEQRIRERRPRIPSIVPLRDANLQPRAIKIAEETRLREYAPASLTDDEIPVADSSASIPSSSKDRRVASMTEDISQLDPTLVAVSCASDYLPPIDTASLPESCSALSGNLTNGKSFDSLSAPDANNSSTGLSGIQTSTSGRRAAAPPPLNLGSMNTLTSQESFQGLLNLIDFGNQSDVVTPSSSGSGSCSSQLSAFPMTATSSSSAPTTAFPTPVDEAIDKLDTSLAVTTDGLQPSISAQAVCGMRVGGEK